MCSRSPVDQMAPFRVPNASTALDPQIRVANAVDALGAPIGQPSKNAGLQFRRFAGAVKPLKVRLFAEPDQLSSRVASILAHDQFACGGFVAHAVKVLEHLSVD